MEISTWLMGLGRKMLRVLTVVACVLFAGVASAERRVALVMGDDDYRNVRKLDNAINDARTLEETLKKLGFDVFLEPTVIFAACVGRSTISVRTPRAPTWHSFFSPGMASRSVVRTGCCRLTQTRRR